MFQLKINGDPVAYFRDRQGAKHEAKQYASFNKVEIIEV
jgi:hypothetical protein